MNIFERIRASEKIRLPISDDSQISALPTISTVQSHVARWGTLRSRVAGHGLLSTVLTVGSMTLLVKIVAAGKETVVAGQLGVGNALDAFIVAYTLPALAMGVIAGSFNSALVPTYIEVREREGKVAAQRLFSNVTYWSVGLLLLVTGLLALLFPLILPILATSFGPEKLALTRLLFWVLLPIITITGLATTWAAILNAEGNFVLPSATPIMSSLIVAILILVWGHTRGVWGLAIGTLVGACLEAGLIGDCLRRRGVSLLPRRMKMDEHLRQVLLQYAPQAAAVLVFSGTTLADQAIAARLGAGSISALNYGNKITALFIGVTATTVGTSVLPHFSRLVAVDDWKSLHRDMILFTLVTLAILIPLALLLAFFSVPLVRFLFERGAFTPHDTFLVGHVQACLALQIPFFAVYTICNRVACALKIIRKNFLIAAFGVLLNFILDIVFVRYFGVAGIALSTTVVSCFSAGVIFLIVIRTMPLATTTL